MGRKGKQQEVDNFFLLDFFCCCCSFLFSIFSFLLRGNVFVPSWTLLIHSRKGPFSLLNHLFYFILLDCLVHDTQRFFALVKRKFIPFSRKTWKRRKDPFLWHSKMWKSGDSLLPLQRVMVLSLTTS